jgi:hypothetical protein
MVLMLSIALIFKNKNDSDCQSIHAMRKKLIYLPTLPLNQHVTGTTPFLFKAYAVNDSLQLKMQFTYMVVCLAAGHFDFSFQLCFLFCLSDAEQ